MDLHFTLTSQKKHKEASWPISQIYTKSVVKISLTDPLCITVFLAICDNVKSWSLLSSYETSADVLLLIFNSHCAMKILPSGLPGSGEFHLMTG